MSRIKRGEDFSPLRFRLAHGKRKPIAGAILGLPSTNENICAGNAGHLPAAFMALLGSLLFLRYGNPHVLPEIPKRMKNHMNPPLCFMDRLHRLLREVSARSLPCSELVVHGTLLRASVILPAVLANLADLRLFALHVRTSFQENSPLHLHGLGTVPKLLELH